jgi:hypothetical protein
MKKKYTYLFAVLCAAFTLGSCSGTDEEVTPSSKLVAVTVNLPGTYNTASRATDHPALKDSTAKPLPEGSTLWLYIKNSSDAIQTVQGYIVKTAKTGVQALYQCPNKNNSDGTIGIDTVNYSTTPLYLDYDTGYKFYAISPALNRQSGNSDLFKIGNGVYALATNDAWNQTMYVAATFPSTGSNSATVELNPLMQIGARMTFTIVKSSNINSVSMIQSGVEIDGIGDQVPVDYHVGDNLSTNVGNPYNRMFIAPDKFAETKDGKLYAKVGILPIDCRSTQVYIILNMMINGTPVQKTFTVNNRYFQPGYSYDYTIKLDVQNSITVAEWQENSWTYTAN